PPGRRAPRRGADLGRRLRSAPPRSTAVSLNPANPLHPQNRMPAPGPPTFFPGSPRWCGGAPVERQPTSGENLTPVKSGPMDNIRSKTIAITGAARGIGYATATALLARGARVVIGDRDAALQESAVAQLGRLGPVSGYPLDVTDRESFATFLDKARTDGGGHIDVLINNAGVMPIGPFLEQSEQAIRSSIEVNLYGVLTGCQLALPDMVRRRSGHIINIASMSGLIPVPGQVPYNAAKFGVVGLSVALADEMAPYGVEVSVVMPPFTRTELISGTKETAATKP